MTITGVGGVGKTRLAIQVAADLLPQYREGAWLVELASVRDPEGVVDVVAEAFHLTARGGQSLEDSLIDQLSHKQLLLVLDNCEHVLGSVARLVARIERKLSRRGGAGDQSRRYGDRRRTGYRPSAAGGR